MIRVNITREDDRIRKITVEGHAEMDDAGKDLVCAGVSCIMYGLCNALDEMNAGCKIKVGENRFEIQDPGSSETSKIILSTGYYQLKTIEEVYSEFIKITEV
ncbi:MAG: ribosomal-processing cysteine protease Prp [Solobacterium sp.]|nr:ribosomal-processing cysteine protease Prp [Solobacterium sp.]